VITYLKLSAIAALVAALFFSGYHVGGMASKTKLEGFEAAQAADTAKAVMAERASAATELARVNAILKEYQDAPIDPIVPGIAHRVFIYARAADCPVPSAGPHPGGTVTASPQPAGPGPIEQATQAVFDACEADARELTALQAAWPR
jgi:hypothetical protein